MGTTGLQDTRQRAVTLIEEAGTLLGMIPRLLDENDSLRASVDAAAMEAEALRGEIDALRSDLQHLRTEREELAEILAKIATDMGRLGEIVSKPRAAEMPAADPPLGSRQNGLLRSAGNTGAVPGVVLR
jgi:chromosome segregation ATPase